MSKLSKAIYNQLFSLWKLEGVKQREMAEKTGVGQTHFSKILNGTRDPIGLTVETFEKMLPLLDNIEIIYKDEQSIAAEKSSFYGLPDDERELLELYRSMHDSKKELVIGMIKGAVDYADQKTPDTAKHA